MKVTIFGKPVEIFIDEPQNSDKGNENKNKKKTAGISHSNSNKTEEHRKNIDNSPLPFDDINERYD